MDTHVISPALEIGLVKIKVSQLERSIVYYTEVIGLQVLQQDDTTAHLSADGIHPIVIIKEIANAVILPPQSAAGLYHFAILLPDRVSLGLALRNLLQHRQNIGQGDHLVSEALYLNDPDNNGIEIYADRPKETWQKDEHGYIIMGTEPVDVEGLLELAEGKTWTGLPAGTKIGHVHFHVSDLSEARRFYVDVLGFEMMLTDNRSVAFIAAGGYHHHLGLNTWAGVGVKKAPANAAGIDYYSLQLPDRQALDEVKARVRSAGIPADEEEQFLWVTDPSHIRILFYTAAV
ncbi:VOC family protein [Paenibacillus bovis]|uniref:Glyoxalase n=1 Tax=Paenibacillus bovis TaxID=1616788 RepID=A0A172ZGR8_9BACL|nr:VOC family protein [Paenibacillus bovis]ANF96844.1 glyoxalase [Paenibacillus bovis]